MNTRWQLAHGRHMDLGCKAVIMGVLNVTPDSFSDGGEFLDPGQALLHAGRMLDEGAKIIDVGGESTRPGATPATARVEQDRILPIVKALARSTDALISIDTYRAETARQAIDEGAHIVNDVWGLQKDRDIARLAAETGTGLVVMHTGRERNKLPDVIEDQCAFLQRSLAVASEAGVAPDQIVLDPGFGFAKDADENLELMARFEELLPLGRPLMAGTSRKRFIGSATGRNAGDRDVGTAASSAILRLKGALLFRVHNVAANIDALTVGRGRSGSPEKGGRMLMYVIAMKNCAFFARHGVHDEEETLGQRFYIDAVLTVDPGDALETDAIQGTVDYGAAFRVIEGIVTGRRRFLIEALALEVAKALNREFEQIRKSEITVRKPNAPVPGILDHVEVTVAWPE